MTVISVVKDADARTLTITARFAAPIARVWQVWSDPRQLERWWGPPGYPATVTEHDLAPGGTVAYAITDGIVIFGLGADDIQAAIDAHAEGSSLANTDAYVRTFEVAGERAGNEAYVDIGALVELLGLDADLPADARDILSQVGTFGFTAPSREDQIEFHAVLTIDEARPE